MLRDASVNEMPKATIPPTCTIFIAFRVPGDSSSRTTRAASRSCRLMTGCPSHITYKNAAMHNTDAIPHTQRRILLSGRR